jgi:hypothetical protein
VWPTPHAPIEEGNRLSILGLKKLPGMLGCGSPLYSSSRFKKKQALLKKKMR